jgi:hypothetical protein
MRKMADRPWKVFERSTAIQLGTHRALMKGTKEKSDLGDQNFPLIVDCKLRKKWQLHKWLRELREYAFKEREARKGFTREPVLVVRRPPYLKRYAIVSFLWLFGHIQRANAVTLFTYLHKPLSNRWNIGRWHKEAEKKAEAENKIALLTVEDMEGVRYAVLSVSLLASILRSAGVLPQYREE